MTESEDNSNAIIRPDGQTALALFYENRSLFFSSARYGNLNLGMKWLAVRTKGHIFV